MVGLGGWSVDLFVGWSVGCLNILAAGAVVREFFDIILAVFQFLNIFLVPGPIPSCSPFDEIQFPGIKTQNDLTSVEKQANPSEFLILIIF